MASKILIHLPKNENTRKKKKKGNNKICPQFQISNRAPTVSISRVFQSSLSSPNIYTPNCSLISHQRFHIFHSPSLSVSRLSFSKTKTACFDQWISIASPGRSSRLFASRTESQLTSPMSPWLILSRLFNM